MKNERFSALMRDLSLLTLLLWAFGQALLMAYSAEEQRVAYLVMMFAMDAAVLVGYMGRPSLGLVLCGTLTCVWIGYKLYAFYMWGELLALGDFLLAPLPLIGGGGAALYHYGLQALNNENRILRQQVEEYVLMDERTGLYNLRALFRDLQMMTSYAHRNGWPISLMIVQLRYESEYRRMLSARQYDEFLHRFINAVSHSVRVEDRIYSIDDKGTVAVILTTDEKGGRIVANRIRSSVAQSELFEGILDKGTYIDLRIAQKQYEERYGKNMQQYKNEVENELVYDV